MDFHSLKRKELQSLCRKHQIPANLTNLEMAKRLTALSAVDEKRPLTRGRRSCLKNPDDIASGNESDLEVRPAKKVKFSPENETIEFEKSKFRYSQVNGGRRTRSAMSGDKGISVEKVNEEVKESGVSGREVKVEGKRGNKVDDLKSREVVTDRATRQAKRRLLMAGSGVECGDKGTTSDMAAGGDTEAQRGKRNAPGIREKKTAKTDCSDDKATIQNVENEEMKPKRGRSIKGSSEDKATFENVENEETKPESKATIQNVENGEMRLKRGRTNKGSSEDKATIQNVENEVTRPKRGRPRKGRTSEGMLVASETEKMVAKVEVLEDKERVGDGSNENAKRVKRSTRGKSLEVVHIESETGKIAAKLEASKVKELVDIGLNENAKQVRRSRRGKAQEVVQIESRAGERAIKPEDLEDNGLLNDGVTAEVTRLTRSRRGKSPEGVKIEGKPGKRTTQVKALENIVLVEDRAIGEVKGDRGSRRGKSPEGLQAKSKTVSNENVKKIGKSVKGKTSKDMQAESKAVKEVVKDVVIEKGLVDTGLGRDAKIVRQSRRGKSAAGILVEGKAENKVTKDEGLRYKGPVDDGLHGDAKEVRRSRRGKSAEETQAESKAAKKSRKDEAWKDEGHIDDGLVGDAKEVRRSRRNKSPEVGKEVSKDKASKNQGTGLNGNAKEVRRSRRGKSPEATKVKMVTMDDFIEDAGITVDSAESNPLVKRQGQALTCEERNKANDSLAAHIRAPLPAEDCFNSSLECVDELDEQPEAVLAGTNSDEERNEGRDSQTMHIKAPLTAEEDCHTTILESDAGLDEQPEAVSAGTNGNSELVIDDSGTQPEGVIESRNSEAHSDEETAEEIDSQAKNIRTPSTAENDGADGNLELADDLDKHHETAIGNPTSKLLSQTTYMRTPLTERKDYSGGNTVLVIGESLVQNEAVLESQNLVGNDYGTKDIGTPSTAEDVCVDVSLELSDDLIKHHETAIESTNSEARSHEEMNEGNDSHAKHIKTPLTEEKDYRDGNTVLVIGESLVRNEAVLESQNLVGNDYGTKDIGTPSTAEDVCVDVSLELSDDLIKHHETAMESTNSEARSHEEMNEGNDSQGKNIKTPLAEEKDCTDGNMVLVIGESLVQNEATLESNLVGNDFGTKDIRTSSTAEDVCVDVSLELSDDLIKHHETAIESTNSEVRSHGEINEGNDSHAKHIKPPLTEEKDCRDGNTELGADYLDNQHKAVLESIDSETHFNKERCVGSDSQTTDIMKPLVAERDCIQQREEMSPIKMNNSGAHNSSATLTNFHDPEISSLEDTKTDECESSKMAAKNSESLLAHKPANALGRSASALLLLDRDVNCREDIAYSPGMQGDMLYCTEPSAEGVETESYSGNIFDTKSIDSAQTSPSFGLNGNAAVEASNALDLEAHLVMSAQSLSEQNRGDLDQGVHAAKLNEHEDFGRVIPQDDDLDYPLESHEESSSYYKSSSHARTNICHTQDQVEDPVAACDKQSTAFSPGSEGTQIVDFREGYGVCSGVKINEESARWEAVFMTHTPSSGGGDAETVKGTVSMDRRLDVEANAFDDQPALRMEGEASCQERNSEGKVHMRTPLTAEKVHMECSLYRINDDFDKRHAAVGESTSSEAHSSRPCEVNEEELMLQNSEGKERMQPNLEAVKHSEAENSEILICDFDVGSSYNINDGQAEAVQIQTTLNSNERMQEDDTTLSAQPAEVLPMQMSSCGLSDALQNLNYLEMGSLDDLKPIECSSSKIVPMTSLDTLGRSISMNNSDENIRYSSDMQGEVLAFNETSAMRVEIAPEFSGIADDSGTESYTNAYPIDWDVFEAEFNAGVHGFNCGNNAPPEDCEEGYRYPLNHAKVLEEEQGASLYEMQVNEHQLNTNETVSNIQAPDILAASVSSMFSASEVADLVSEMRSDLQNCTSKPEELDQGLLETAGGSILETEAHQCTGNADEALDHNLDLNFKSDSLISSTSGGAASESISSAMKHSPKSKNARSILMHGTPKRQPATAHSKGNASVSRVNKVGSLTTVRTAKLPPSAHKPWK